MVAHCQQLYIGLISGTSADGIDAGLFDFDTATPRLVETHHQPYDPSIKASILDLTQPGNNEIDRLGEFDVLLGHLFAATTKSLIEKANIASSQVLAIGSHGQTIRHRPHATSPFTLQIADPNVISQQTGLTTVADFRRRDIAANGQGAPLAPAFHRAAFWTQDEARCILNIGGIANVSLLHEEPKRTIGYDTGPGNVLMDAWIHHKTGADYDNDGTWAASGQVDEALLRHLLSHPYLHQPYPKSTGREDFHLTWLLDILAHYKHIEANGVQATLCEFSAISIAEAIGQHECLAVYVCGGGANNKDLMARLTRHLPDCQVATTAILGIAPDWVETGLCAWLAKRTLERKPGNLPSVTGARDSVILGAIFPA